MYVAFSALFHPMDPYRYYLLPVYVVLEEGMYVGIWVILACILYSLSCAIVL